MEGQWPELAPSLAGSYSLRINARIRLLRTTIERATHKTRKTPSHCGLKARIVQIRHKDIDIFNAHSVAPSLGVRKA